MGNLPACRSASTGVGLLVSAAVAVAMLPLIFARAAEPDKIAPPKYLSPIAMVADKAGKTIYIAQATAGQIAVFDVATRKVTANIAIGPPVSGIAISPDGTTLYVTAGGAEGKLCVIDIKNRKITARISVGHTPISPVAGPDGKTVLDRVIREMPTGQPQSAPPVTFAVRATGQYKISIKELYGKKEGLATLTV